MTDSASGDLKRDPDDGRDKGEWVSRYPLAAWFQIFVELIYLLVLLVALSSALLYIGVCITNADRKSSFVSMSLFALVVHREMLQWVIVTIAGGIGGVVFDLKWLYHSVARGLWTRDRGLWRLLVPMISAVVSVFLAFIIVSGLLPFFKSEAFRTTYFALGFGFIFGYFSDNVIAALQNFAQKNIGTTNTEPRPHD
ncbi:hypothetical protein [Rhizobium sp. BT-226]|uniref:hypothetical protein n=1 Tax=Rhizobium sp. BT-226 TaxID=2986922 RepID=UPI0021F7463B|nr:hypothetical protein [Rhizobium sp. BT-226]MCW0016061.1 hypothetical protein [Rhizobium sp. BT-226]